MPQALFEQEWNEARGLGLVDRVFKVKRIFKVSWQTVVYRVALGRPDDEQDAIWQRFRDAYQARFGRSAPKTTEPDPLDAKAFAGAPISRTADEPARFVDRAAEILRLSLVDMRTLRNLVGRVSPCPRPSSSSTPSTSPRRHGAASVLAEVDGLEVLAEAATSGRALSFQDHQCLLLAGPGAGSA